MSLTAVSTLEFTLFVHIGVSLMDMGTSPHLLVRRFLCGWYNVQNMESLRCSSRFSLLSCILVFSRLIYVFELLICYSDMLELDRGLNVEGVTSHAVGCVKPLGERI